MKLRHRFQDYLYRKWVANLVAFLIVIALWFLFPSLLVQVFNWNAEWVSDLWYGVFYPYLPTEIQLASEAVGAAHDAVLAGVDFASYLSGAEVEAAARLEATARILLIGELLLVIIGLSILLRLLHLAYWFFFRRKKNEEYAIALT